MIAQRIDIKSIGDSRTCNQVSFAVQESSVDWSQFDIVVSVDISISLQTINLHPKVVWAYFITEGCMNSYKSSLESPIEGYDLFLTQVNFFLFFFFSFFLFFLFFFFSFFFFSFFLFFFFFSFSFSFFFLFLFLFLLYFYIFIFLYFFFYFFSSLIIFTDSLLLIF